MNRIFEKPLEFLAGSLMFIIAAVVFLQVVSRYLLEYPLIWPEELAKYLFVWAGLLGAALASIRGLHFSVDSLITRFSGKWQIAIRISVNVILSIFTLIIAIKGFQLSMAVKDQTSAGMEISMVWPYLSVPVSFSLMFLYSLADIYKIVKNPESIVKIEPQQPAFDPAD